MKTHKRAPVSASDAPWYRSGLRFECQRCGRCCGGAPGYVWVTLEEISAIARFLNLSEAAFAQTFLRYIGDRVSLIEYDNGDCAMYDRGCKVYPVRPRQCQSFPFWQSNLSSPMAWERLKERCPGVGKGRLHTYREILAWL